MGLCYSLLKYYFTQLLHYCGYGYNYLFFLNTDDDLIEIKPLIKPKIHKQSDTIIQIIPTNVVSLDTTIQIDGIVPFIFTKYVDNPINDPVDVFIDKLIDVPSNKPSIDVLANKPSIDVPANMPSNMPSNMPNINIPANKPSIDVSANEPSIDVPANKPSIDSFDKPTDKPFDIYLYSDDEYDIV